MILMTLSTPIKSNGADWREAYIWLRGMAGMGLHRNESVMDGMTFNDRQSLNLKLAHGQSYLSRQQVCIHSRIQDV